MGVGDRMVRAKFGELSISQDRGELASSDSAINTKVARLHIVR